MPTSARRGCDSAGEPTLAQAFEAKAAGIGFWGVYIAGAGATHNWSIAGVTVLRRAGIAPLPIYVPAMSSGLIASQAPEADARAFVAAYRSAGIDGAGVLDTEASMRADPWTAPYAQRFCAELAALGQADICYAGAFFWSAPPAARFVWWIVASEAAPPAPPGICYQAGPGNFAGIDVDLDYAGSGFPLARFIEQPHELAQEGSMFIRDPRTGEIDFVSGGRRYDIGAHGDGWGEVLASAEAQGVPAPLLVDDTDGAWFATFPAA